MKFFIFFLLFLLIYVLFSVGTLPYSNPYTLNLYIGKKGCGKTTTMCKLAHRSISKGRTVYSNVALPGCYLIQDNDIGRCHLEPNSVLLWDEAGMVFDNRNFKNFRPEWRDFFKLQRHYKIQVHMFSQTADIDKKLRDLCDSIWILEKKFNIFTYGKRVLKKIVVTEAIGDQPSVLADQLRIDSLLFAFFGSRSLTLIPRWAGSFDSFEAPQLSGHQFPYVDIEWQPLKKRTVFLRIFRNALHSFRIDKAAKQLHRAAEVVESGIEDAADQDPSTHEYTLEEFFTEDIHK